MDSTFLKNLQTEFALPEDGVMSRVLLKDKYVNVTLRRHRCGRCWCR